MNARQATPEDAEAELAERELARRHLFDFVERTHPAYSGGWVHRLICRRLERFADDVAAGRSPRLILTMPPRHGKTAIVSQRFPVWVLGRYPEIGGAPTEIAVASYAQELADDNSREARVIARSPEALAVFPRLRPEVEGKRYLGDYRRADVDKITMWKAGPGSYKAVGVGGPLTGRGAHFLIIDDPIKDRASADSDTLRDALWAWYRSTAYTRVAPGGGVIVMATRWHEDDLIGRLLDEQKHGGDQWEVLDLPAIDTADTVDPETGEVCRRAGEALHEARWPLSSLEQRKRAVGEREWAALYLCRPTSAGGNVIRREWTTKRHEFHRGNFAQVPWDRVWSSCDPTFGRSATSDYVSIQVWAQRGTMRHLIDRVSARMTSPELRQAYLDLHAKWPEVTARLVEKTANGQGLHDELVGKMEIILVPVSSNVVPGKFQTTAHLWEAGCVILPESSIAPWVGEYVEQIVTIPAAAHDDDGAATAHALSWSVEQGAGLSFDPAAHLAAAHALGGWSEPVVAPVVPTPGGPLRW